jgi:hypothetical protein
MIWCDLLSAVSIFIILMALLFGTWKIVFFATLVSAILSQFSQPSQFSVPDGIEKIIVRTSDRKLKIDKNSSAESRLLGNYQVDALDQSERIALKPRMLRGTSLFPV